MMRPLILSAVLPAILAAGCGRTPTTDIPKEAVVLDMRQFPEEVAQMWHSSVEERARHVIRDQAAWTAFWRGATSHIMPPPAVPAVDFTADMVIVAGMGSRPSGGYRIAIESVNDAGSTVHVVVKETSPGPRCGVTLGITAPLTAVRVPRRDATVQFVERSETADCP